MSGANQLQGRFYRQSLTARAAHVYIPQHPVQYFGIFVRFDAPCGGSFHQLILFDDFPFINCSFIEAIAMISSSLRIIDCLIISPLTFGLVMPPT